MSRIPDIRERNAIEAEASAWIVQLDARAPSKADLAALREWVGRSALHLETIRRLADLWSRLDVLTELADASPVPAAQTTRTASRAAPWLAAAATVLLVAAATAALLVRTPQPASDPAERGLHVTAVGEQQQLALSDGSQININTDSILEVDFDDAERRVRLVRGEALFEVSEDPERPFVVYAGRSAVRAVGTAFSVRIKADELEVRVTEGSVELVPDASEIDTPRPTAPPTGVRTVEASQTASLAADGPRIETVDEAELERLLSWRDGMLSFDGEPLSQVVEEVSRYTPTRIEIADAELRDLHIGGYFRVGETEALLEALETGFGVEITREGDDLVRLSMAESR